LLLQEDLPASEHLVSLGALLYEAVEDFYQKRVGIKLNLLALVVLRTLDCPVTIAVGDELLSNLMEVEEELVFDHARSDLVVHAFE
jgi:hypothetical protein